MRRNPNERLLATANAWACLRELRRYACGGGYPGDDDFGLPTFAPQVPPFDDTAIVHLGDGLDTAEFESRHRRSGRLSVPGDCHGRRRPGGATQRGGKRVVRPDAGRTRGADLRLVRALEAPVANLAKPGQTARGPRPRRPTGDAQDHGVRRGALLAAPLVPTIIPADRGGGLPGDLQQLATVITDPYSRTPVLCRTRHAVDVRGSAAHRGASRARVDRYATPHGALTSLGEYPSDRLALIGYRRVSWGLPAPQPLLPFESIDHVGHRRRENRLWKAAEDYLYRNGPTAASGTPQRPPGPAVSPYRPGAPSLPASLASRGHGLVVLLDQRDPRRRDSQQRSNVCELLIDLA